MSKAQLSKPKAKTKAHAAKPKAARPARKAVSSRGAGPGVARKKAAPAKAKPASRPKAPAKPAAPKPRRPAKPAFNKATLDGISKKLTEQRKDLVDQLADLEEEAFNLSQSELSGEVSYDEDYADAGSFTFEREKDLSIANNVQDLLDKIDRALQKIAEGTYGICESCGQPIDAARLRALPHVSLCIRCKKAEERR